MNGYRKMISDNIPKTWDFALRYCKCRTRWIEYVYETHVKPYDKDWRSKNERKRLKSRACKQYTGQIKDDFGNYTSFNLTINTDQMLLKDKGSYDYWTSIIKWVNWFREKLKYIEDSMTKKSLQTYDDRVFFLSVYYTNGNEKLAEFIVKQLGYANTSK